MKMRFLLPVLSGLALSAAVQAAQNLPAVEVYKSPYCGCCAEWVKHMQQAGFTVHTHEVQDVPAARQGTGMPEAYASCHTARVGGYAIEGHVPAADVKRLLAEKPKAVGLAVPGMVQGSPGMEGASKQPYNTLLIGQSGTASVYAKH